MQMVMVCATGLMLAFWGGSGVDPHPHGWLGNTIALIALATMEIVLGIDNIVFISIVTSKLPAAQQPLARRCGLLLALGMRLLLLMSIFWIMSLTTPLITLSDWVPLPEWKEWLTHEGQLGLNEISIKDLILLGGGLFLLFKSVKEIHHLIEHRSEEVDSRRKAPSFLSVLIQIMMLDLVFSLDSVITAVGMAEELWVMMVSVIIAVIVMMIFATPVAHFVERNPSVKMLALSFLMLIGIMLIADGFGTHVSKGYVYFAMAFSLLVEVLNLRARREPTSAGGSTSA